MSVNVHTLQNQLIVHEGLKLKPYRCTTGKLTIGVGRNLEDNGISENEARILLLNDICDSLDFLRKSLSFFDSLSVNRQYVLIDMCFNLGGPGLMKFVRTLDAISRGEYELASRHMLDSRWANQVGQRAKTLSIMMAEDKPFPFTKG